VALHEGTKGSALLALAAGGILMAGGVALVLFGPGFDAGLTGWLLAAPGLVGLLFIGAGVWLRRRSDRPFLILRPENMSIAGLDRPIAWADLLSMHMTLTGGTAVIRMLLSPEAPFPAPVRRGRRVKLNAGRRTVSFTAVPPRHLRAQGFADLIISYRHADAARRHLAGTAPPPET
jgi:hypothetical protein